MKKLLILPACISALGLSAGSVFAADSTPLACSLATLHGTYAFAGTGIKNLVWSGTSGMESYDGHGNLKYHELESDGITQNTFTGTGTYTITANCIATVIYDGDVTDRWTLFVAPDGSVFYYNNNLGFGKVSAGHEDRISKALLVQ
jgi:hypothetical protein